MELELPKKIINILEKNSIDSVAKLKNLSRSNLKEFGLTNEEINKITIKLQLAGYDLKKKNKRNI